MLGGLDKAFEGLGAGLRLPDLWQSEAISALLAGKDAVVSAPTGAGKTYVFESLVQSRKLPAPGRQAVYTVPTRALANEKWREWRRLGWKVGLATGDLAEDTDAPVLVATLETQRERFLAGEGPQLLVIDEYQMIGDRRRGLSYELAVALAPPSTRLLLLSGSVANPGEVAAWLRRLGREAVVVESGDRPVPLEELPLGALPRSAPPKYTNFWHRLALGVLLSQAGPLLVFAPHRRAAEKIARKIAEVLPEDDPIRFGDRRLEQACSPELARLLRRRVAYHHSGLTYAERAALVEPLAKAGQLRVVVATMGLAAGINFSVRSVFVAGTSYQDGPFERFVAPDELLQMFGRAGRRGLDECGFLVCGRDGPRLGDARPARLRRHNELDWPTLIRRMDLAARAGKAPLEAARELRDRLFSVQELPLGFRPGSGEGSEVRSGGKVGEGGEAGLFDLRPLRKEILNAEGEWEPRRPDREGEAPLGELLVRRGEAWLPAMSDPDLVRSLLPPGSRLVRLDRGGEGVRRYGLEIAVASRTADGGYRPTRLARKLAGSPRDEAPYSPQEAAALLPELFREHLAPARVVGTAERGGTLALLAELDAAPFPCYRDEGGRALHEPPSRSIEVVAETRFSDAESGGFFEPAPGTPAHAWRQLGLVDESGRPTRRGTVFSLFQGGEGLAVAAALEEPAYPAEDLALHLANLRAGHRFDLDGLGWVESLAEAGGSDRLAAACRRAFGPVDHEGYLSLGLPPQYGEGAAEILSLHLEGRLGQLAGRGLALDFGPGDVERVLVEWLSLLRHLRAAPELGTEDPRWSELKTAAGRLLDRYGRRTPLADLPELPAPVLQRPARRGIAYGAI
jgi:hypothetical protein